MSATKTRGPTGARRHRMAAALVVASLAAGCGESVAFKSYPAGAKVSIDGLVIGTTPTYTTIPRDQVGLPHTWTVEYRNCDVAEGPLQSRVAGGRIPGYIFTLGLLAIFRGPRYYPEVDAILTGGDCEATARSRGVTPKAGVVIQNIVGDKNSTGGGLSKTDQLEQRLTTLRDLYNRKLISEATYEKESQKAIRELAE